MTRSAFTEELENAADQIADIPSADLQNLLRQAALQMRVKQKETGKELWIPCILHCRSSWSFGAAAR